MLQYLSDEQLENLKTYKHHADKTTLEQFYTNKLLVPVEKIFPTVRCMQLNVYIEMVTKRHHVNGTDSLSNDYYILLVTQYHNERATSKLLLDPRRCCSIMVLFIRYYGWNESKTFKKWITFR